MQVTITLPPSEWGDCVSVCVHTLTQSEVQDLSATYSSTQEHHIISMWTLNLVLCIAYYYCGLSVQKPI